MEKMSTEELKKELEKLKDFKVYVFEGDVYVKAEDYREKAIENKNLKLTLEQMENTCKDYLNDRDTIREENKSLKKENKRLMSDLITTIEERDNNIKRVEQLEERLDNKEKVNKSMREEVKELNKMMLFETKIEK